ncbi:MAG: hypothetical protein EXQ63_05345 [Ilumatobacteraceae bacterium]|nr:hypothetical protein [Ilumatobacteraceae bacterium]
MAIARRTLVDVLEEAQRLGTLGDRPVAEVIVHARQFLPALEQVTGKVVDIGTGAGIPGLVIALDRPDLLLTLVDRRQTRMDALQRGVTALGLQDRVTVLCTTTQAMAREITHKSVYRAALSRGFGSPVDTLEAVRPLLMIGGWAIVSEPPTPQPNRWPHDVLERLGFAEPQYLQGVAMFHVEQ